MFYSYSLCCKLILNSLFTYLVIGSTVVLFWRGTWGLLDIWILPFEPEDYFTRFQSAITTYCMGFILMAICTAIYLFKKLKEINSCGPKWFEVVSSYIWTYALALISVFCWRGVWLLWDCIPISPLWQGVIAHCLGIVFPILLLTFRSVVAPPGIVVHDEHHNFDIPIWTGFSIRNRVNPEVVNPEVVNPGVVNPEVINPGVVNPGVVNPEVVNPEVVNPEVVNPELINPGVVNPEVVNPEVVNPEVVEV